MIAKPKKSCVHSTRTGLTLIEVIAATLLLGTLLVAILMAYGRHAKQIKQAQQQLVVIDALDKQIADWYLTRRGIPLNESGPLLVNQPSPVQWQTRTLNDEATQRILLSQKVRVEAKTASGNVLAYVDVLQAATR